jgi:5-methylthioadenosine/S-adenosylhomocysteine deaminase
MVVDLRVRGGTVVTLDRERRVEQADVYVKGGRVAAVGGAEQEASRQLDAAGMLVMPGMHDLHNHLRELTPGLRLGEGLKLDDLLRRYWEMSEAMGPTEYRVGAALATARLLKAGVTSVVDHLYPFHHPGLAEASIEGYSMTGIRWFLARGIMTGPYAPISERAEEAFRAIRELADGVVPKERLLVAPVSFRQAPPEVYAEARRFADRHHLRLYTHVAETQAEVDGVRKEHGARPVELLHRLGFSGPDTVLVHCVLISPREVRLLAQSGTHVVHCPSNHMKLAKGVSPVPALLEAGVNVCLGVDTMDDLFTEVRQEVLLQGLHASNPAAVSPRDALDMATLRGASALGLGGELGVIEPGRRADLVCVDVRGVTFQPVLDPVWTLVHRAHGADVAHVVVDGRVVVEGRRLLCVDEEALVEEAKQVASSFLRRNGLSQEVLSL